MPAFTRSPKVAKHWYRILYVQVLVAVLLGIIIGFLFPDIGKSLKPLGDGFIKLVKMLIAPIIFCTIVHGIASMGDLKKLGRVGAKALLYFEVVSTLALVIGLLVVNVLQPGKGFTPAGESFRVDPPTANVGQAYTEKVHSLSITDYLLNIIPNSFLGAFVSGDLLQVLFIAILVAFAIAFMRERGRPVLTGIEYATQLFFGVMHIVLMAAPVGAFGAMAYTVGSYGLVALHRLLILMAGFYLTAALFVVVVLGAIAWYSGFSIFRFLNYIRDELLLVLGTSSSEVAL